MGLSEMWLERLEVSDTVRRYFLAMDEFDWAAAGEQLADRVTLDASAFDVPAREVSREQYLAELIARNGGYEVSLHMNADHVVDVDGDHARVRSHFFGAHSVGPDDVDGYWAYGVYDIELVKLGGVWKMARLSVKPFKTHGGKPVDVAARAVARLRDVTATPTADVDGA